MLYINSINKLGYYFVYTSHSPHASVTFVYITIIIFNSDVKHGHGLKLKWKLKSVPFSSKFYFEFGNLL